MKNLSWKTQKSTPEVSQFSEKLKISDLMVQLTVNKLHIY